MLTPGQSKQIADARIKLVEVRKEIKEAKQSMPKRDLASIMFDMIDATQEIADVIANLA